MDQPVFAIAFALWAVGFLLLPRLRRFCAASEPASAASVSIVVPVHRESQNLPKLLASLASQAVKPKEIVVVDDSSGDRASEAARLHGAKILKSQPLPGGWQKKAWAFHQGARATTGELLLFMDEDIWFEPGGLANVLRTYKSGAMAIGPYNVVRKPYEHLSLFFNLATTIGTVPDGLFDEFLLVERGSYLRVGGHKTVKSRTFQNAALLDYFRDAGIRVQSLSGKGTLSSQMYPNGLLDLVEGWTTRFVPGIRRAPRIVMAILLAWMTGLALAPFGLFSCSNWLVWSILYLLCALQVTWFGRQVGSYHWLAGLFYPVPLLLFFGIALPSVTVSRKTEKL